MVRERKIELCPSSREAYATFAYKSLHRARLSRQKDYKGYIAVIVIRLRSRITQPGGMLKTAFPCATLARKEDLLKAGVTGRRAIFLAGNPLTDARVL